MKTTHHCLSCLKGLAEQTVTLSGGNEITLSGCVKIINTQTTRHNTPPAIANTILKYIRNRTGVYDPYAYTKEIEFEKAKNAAVKLGRVFSHTLEGVLQFSALGNSADFFVKETYNVSGLKFFGHIDKIEKEIYNKGRDVLILGDNIGDFFFDMPLVKFLEECGKKVHYAVKEHPVQNDLSMPDVTKFRLREIFDNIVSTYTDEVGIGENNIKGIIKDLWNSNAIVIAKGMGNYETISGFHKRRAIIHIMKVKCLTVSEALNKKQGTYIAILGGE